MKIRITFDLDDVDRKAIASHYGEHGKADGASCGRALYSWARGALEETVFDYARHQEAKRQRQEEEDISSKQQRILDDLEDETLQWQEKRGL